MIFLPLLILIAVAQEPQTQPVQSQETTIKTPETQADRGLGDAGAGCIASVKSIPFKRQALPVAVRPYVPRTAFVRLVLNLSGTDTLIVYEMKNRQAEPYLSSPDTRLLVTRQGNPVYRLATKDLHLSRGDDPEWGMDAVAMNVAHLCSADTPLIYLVLQAGTAGGYYIALQPSGEGYKLIPISDAMQGRLVISTSNPRRVEVWDAAESWMCDAFPRQFFIKTMEFDGARFHSFQKTGRSTGMWGFKDPFVVNRKILLRDCRPSSVQPVKLEG